MTLDRLVLWRHGESQYNATERWQGHIDTELTQTGHQEAQRAAQVISLLNPSLIVSSDLIRARKTAAILGDVTGLSVSVDTRLRETNLGKWQGLTSKEVAAEWPGQPLQWRLDPTSAPPLGEARVEVAARAYELVLELDKAHSGVAVLCSHNGTIISLTGLLLNLPIPNWPQLESMRNCHWVVLTRREEGPREWRLTSYNVGVVD